MRSTITTGSIRRPRRRKLSETGRLVTYGVYSTDCNVDVGADRSSATLIANDAEDGFGGVEDRLRPGTRRF